MQVRASDAPPFQVRRRMILLPTVGGLTAAESTRAGRRHRFVDLASEGVAV
jgi:hypothetical protein